MTSILDGEKERRQAGVAKEEDCASLGDLHVNNYMAELVPGLEKLEYQDDLKLEVNEMDVSGDSDEIEVKTDSSYETCDDQDEVAKVSSTCPSPGKRTGPCQESSSSLHVLSESKKSKLSLPSDVNSNQWVAGQIDVKKIREVGLLESGDDLPSSPIFRSRVMNLKPVAPVSTIPTLSTDSYHNHASHFCGDFTNSCVHVNTTTTGIFSSTVIPDQQDVPILQPVPPVTSISSGFGTYAGSKSGGHEVFIHCSGNDDTSVGLKERSQLCFDTSRPLLPVEVALSTIEPSRSAWQELDVADLMNRSKDKVDRLMVDLGDKMTEVKMIRQNGLVHWGGGGQMDWISLGGEEVDEKSFLDLREEEWVPEGVGRRTRAASRSRFSVENYKKTVPEKQKTKDSVENIYDFEDDDAKKQTRKQVNRNGPLDDDNDFIDDGDLGTNSKPGKGKVRGKGRGRGKRLGGGKGRGSRKINPGLDAYFDSVDKTQDSSKPGSDDVSDKSKGISSVEKDEFQPTASISPTTAMCNRILAKSGSGSSCTRKTRPQRGSCPMCGVEMGMKELEVHAAECDG